MSSIAAPDCLGKANSMGLIAGTCSCRSFAPQVLERVRTARSLRSLSAFFCWRHSEAQTANIGPIGVAKMMATSLALMDHSMFDRASRCKKVISHA